MEKHEDTITYRHKDRQFVITYKDFDGEKTVDIPDLVIDHLKNGSFNSMDTQQFRLVTFLLSGLNLPRFIHPYLQMLRKQELGVQIDQGDEGFDAIFADIIHLWGADILTRSEPKQVQYFIARLLELIRDREVSVSFPYRR